MVDYIELGDVASVTKLAGFEFTKYFQYNTTGEIIALRAKNIRDGRLDLSDVHHIDADVSEQLPRSQLHKGDIIFTYTGNGYGDSTIIPESGKFHLAPNICKITPEKVEPYFLFKYMRSSEFLQQVENYMVGSSQPTIPMNTVRKLTIPNISRDTQRTIAEVLSSLDDKIDLLMRQNATLEALTQTYFRQWFMEEVHDDWKEELLSNYVDITRGASPRPIINFIMNGVFPWVKIGDATSSNSIFINNTKEKIIEEGITKSVIAKKGDIILSNSATCGLPYIMGIDGCVHDGWLIFKNYRHLTKWYVYFLLQAMQREITQQADGTVQDNLNTSILKNITIKVPDTTSITKFDELSETIIEKIEQNNAQIQTLQKLRDTLLPKLINGEVRVKQ